MNLPGTNRFLLTITLCLFILFLFILTFRSTIYARRIVADVVSFIANDKKIEEFLPQIKPCFTPKQGLNAEEYYMLNYRSLGIKCEKQ